MVVLDVVVVLEVVVVVLDEVVVVLEDVVVGGTVEVVVVLVVVDELVVDELVVDDLTTTVLAEIVLGVTELELELELELDVLGKELDELSLGASVELTPALATELVDAESPLAATTEEVVVVAFGSN